MEGTFHSPPRTCAWSWSRWFGFGNTQGWAEAGRLQSKGKGFGRQRGGNAREMQASRWFRTGSREVCLALVREVRCWWWGVVAFLWWKEALLHTRSSWLIKEHWLAACSFPWSRSHQGDFPVSVVRLALRAHAGNVQDAWMSLRIHWTDFGTSTGDGGPEDG